MNKTYLFYFVILFKFIQATKEFSKSVLLTISNKQVLKYNEEELISFS